MKKFSLFLLLFILFVGFVACGEKTPDPEPDPDPNEGEVEKEEVLDYFTVAELKGEIVKIVNEYKASSVADLKITLKNGEEVKVIELAYNLTQDKKINSFKYFVDTEYDYYTYVKDGKAYTLVNEVSYSEDLSNEIEEELLSTVSVERVLIPMIKFYDEDAFYNVLEFVKYENNIATYRLKVNEYQGSVLECSGKESIELNITLASKKITAIELNVNSYNSLSVVKTEFLSLTEANIVLPESAK